MMLEGSAENGAPEECRKLKGQVSMRVGQIVAAAEAPIHCQRNPHRGSGQWVAERSFRRSSTLSDVHSLHSH